MFLDEICEKRREQLEREIRNIGRADMRHMAADTPPKPSFYEALAKSGMSFICEVKKASPSKGLLCPDFHPTELATQYASAGAAAISCLTEESYFQGSSRYLAEIAKVVNIPVLRKDFLFDTYQIDEAKVLGASAVLLIAAVLSDGQMQEYLEYAHSLGLDCLVEVHDMEELERMQALKPRILGINNRNLHTFHVDLQTTADLARYRLDGQLLVSESGLHSHADVELVQKCGADAVLIGEALVKSGNISKTLLELQEGTA